VPLSPIVAAFLRRYALCVIALAISLVLLPLLALVGHVISFLPPVVPAQVRNAAFFWPQYLLLPNGISHTITGSIALPSVTPYLMSTFWLLALAAYAWLTRRLHVAWILAGLLPAAALLAQLVILGLSTLGFRPLLDGL
jgi:hypothetical protein